MTKPTTKFPSFDDLVARYYELTDKRDALKTTIASTQVLLDKVNAEIVAKQEHAESLKAKISTSLGGQAFIGLKKEIGQIAGFLKKVPPRPAV